MTAATTVRTDFAMRLYNALARTQATTDFFLSPFSIQVALAMCAAGAKGETRSALAALIGAPTSATEQNREYAALLESVKRAGEHHVELTTANSLWVQQGVGLQPDYQRAVAEYYDGALHELDFRGSPDQAVKTINAWVLAKTAGKIKELIGRQLITADTRLILTNAIHFKGKWAIEFDKSHTWDEDWHGENGACKLPMMHQKGSFLYHETADFQALDLPYAGEQLSMLVVLPKKNDGLPALENKWTAGQTYQQVTGSLAHEDTVIFTLPRFKIETAFQLKPALSDMGAAVAFGGAADFSGISAQPLQISEVIHKAFIEVNEEGTEAAGATGVVMEKSAAIAKKAKCFQADHPFLFAIRHRKTNVVLFSGRMLEPEA